MSEPGASDWRLLVRGRGPQSSSFVLTFNWNAFLLPEAVLPTVASAFEIYFSAIFSSALVEFFIGASLHTSESKIYANKKIYIGKF